MPVARVCACLGDRATAGSRRRKRPTIRERFFSAPSSSARQPHRPVSRSARRALGRHRGQDRPLRQVREETLPQSTPRRARLLWYHERSVLVARHLEARCLGLGDQLEPLSRPRSRLFCGGRKSPTSARRRRGISPERVRNVRGSRLPKKLPVCVSVSVRRVSRPGEFRRIAAVGDGQDAAVRPRTTSPGSRSDTHVTRLGAATTLHTCCLPQAHGQPVRAAVGVPDEVAQVATHLHPSRLTPAPTCT